MPFYEQYWWQQLFVLPSSQVVWWAEVVRSVLRLLFGVIGTVGVVPLLVWLERRLLGWLQGRLGPNRVGPQGLLQPLADALKLMMKEDITPVNVDRALYYMAPGVALAPVILSVTVLPWGSSASWGSVAPGLDIGILFLLAVASIEVYGTILAGWSSNNKYSLLGGLRASSQVISYELGMGLSIIAVLLMTGTLGTQALVMGHNLITPHLLTSGVELSNGQGYIGAWAAANSNYTFYYHGAYSGFWDWNVFRLFPFGLIACIVYLISMIAETNRAPFDLPEAETELVAGFHTEYTSFKFAMFFMGEYANMLVVSWIAVTLFFGGWLAPFGFLSQLPGWLVDYLSSDVYWLVNLINFGIGLFWLYLKLFTLIGFFILVRASFPRLRYDMLMRIGWKGLLPVALVNLVLIAISLAVQETVIQHDSAIAVSPKINIPVNPWWIGQIVAWLVMGALGAIAFLSYYRTYQAKRKTPDAATLALVPIRRGTTKVSVTPAPTPEL